MLVLPSGKPGIDSKMRFHARIQVACFALLGLLVLACFGPIWFAMLKEMKASQSSIAVEVRSIQDDQIPQVAQDSVERISVFNADAIRMSIQSKRRLLRVRRDNPHDKWIVVTSPRSPASDISSLTQIPGWKVLVAGDSLSQTAEYCRFPKCTFLSLEEQFQMGFSIVHKLPETNPIRKNIAYLYAIANGANFIYDFDVESSLDTLETFVLMNNMTGLMYSSPEIVFNSYRHFGQPTYWPRGFPLAYTDVTTSYSYKLYSQWRTPVVQQGMTNIGPDLDAFVLQTRKLNTEKINFDQFVPPTILPEGVFSPINSKNTLFHKEAFWGLFLSSTTSPRTSDIWRGYWLQRLLWEMEGYSGVFPPNANAIHKSFNYLKEMEEEKSMYLSMDKFHDFLLECKCTLDQTFFQCMLQLGSDMVVNQFWEKEDIELTSLWIEALMLVGYPEPQRVTQGSNEELAVVTSEELDVQTKLEKTLSFGTLVTFDTPSEIATPVKADTTFPESINAAQYADAFATLCRQQSTLSIPTATFARVVGSNFQQILLVVVVTEYTNIQYIDSVLKLLFLKVIYCGNEKVQTRLKMILPASKEFIFVEVQGAGDEYMHSLCAIKSMELNFIQSGHLVTGSDIILNLKQLRVLNQHRVWLDEAVFSVLEAQEEIENTFMEKPDSSVDDTLELSIAKEQDRESENLSALLLDPTTVPLELKYVGEIFFIPRHLVKNVLNYCQTFINQGASLANASSVAIYKVLLCNDYEIIPGNRFLNQEWISLKNQMNFKAFLSHVDVMDSWRRSQLCDDHFFLW